MLIRPLSLAAGLVLAGTFALGVAPRPVQDAATPAADTPAADSTWQVDGVHSSVLFRIRHLGVSNFYGTFEKVSGTFAFDPERPAAGRFAVEIAADSVDSNNSGRDNHIKSPDFFNVREYPSISFASTGVTKRDDGRFDLAGDLSFHGVTKPITAVLEWIGSGDKGPRFGVRCGFEARFTIKRSDFGVDTYIKEGTLGDEVELIVSIEGLKP